MSCIGLCVPAYVLIDAADKAPFRFIWQADSWGVDVLPDYIVSSSALIPLTSKPGLHFHNIILAGQASGVTLQTPPKYLGVCGYFEEKRGRKKSNQVVFYCQFVNLNLKGG